MQENKKNELFYLITEYLELETDDIFILAEEFDDFIVPIVPFSHQKFPEPEMVEDDDDFILVN
jgi:hypothetical protein